MVDDLLIYNNNDYYWRFQSTFVLNQISLLTLKNSVPTDSNINVNMNIYKLWYNT